MKSLFTLFVLLISTTLLAKEKIEIGEVAFAGNVSPSEIVNEIYGKKMQREDSSLKVEVTMPNAVADDSKIFIPFYFDNSSKNSTNKNVNDFLEGIDQVFKNLNIVPKEQVKSESACNGLPLNSTITTHWTSNQECIKVKTTFSCLANKQNFDWFAISRTSSAIRGCSKKP